jgi:hypothetical protein
MAERWDRVSITITDLGEMVVRVDGAVVCRATYRQLAARMIREGKFEKAIHRQNRS